MDWGLRPSLISSAINSHLSATLHREELGQVMKQCKCITKQIVLWWEEYPISIAKMASYGQPYSGFGSAMVRALALYPEGREFDSGGLRSEIAKKSKPISQLHKKLLIYRHFGYFKENCYTGPSFLSWVRLRTEAPLRLLSLPNSHLSATLCTERGLVQVW